MTCIFKCVSIIDVLCSEMFLYVITLCVEMCFCFISFLLECVSVFDALKKKKKKKKKGHMSSMPKYLHMILYE